MLLFRTQNTPVLKSVFIIFFRGKLVKEKICTVCEGFKATIYDCPDNIPERMNMVSAIRMEMRDMQIVCITISCLAV
jgi:vacuolar-type H+-ATPase subunit I/STV1